jgi:hydrogenase expression/formation protein HypE
VTVSCPFPIDQYPQITIAHGGGGKLSALLIDQIFAPIFGHAEHTPLHDGALLETSTNQIAMTTDSYVIQPLEFPGGDIGSLAVHGTCNDLAMCGARPRFLSVSFILEAGLETVKLIKIAQSMRNAADEIGVQIVTGDTKVIESGRGDGMYINTTGVGEILSGWNIGPQSICEGDKIILSGDVGQHGAAIMAVRDGLKFSEQLQTDSAHVYPLVENLHNADVQVSCFRDCTRGGLATALYELSTTRLLPFDISESAIRVESSVFQLCELLGLDPLFVANEGRMIAVVSADDEQKALQAMGPTAVSIGSVAGENKGRVVLHTRFGTTRILRPHSGEQLPRIC